VNQSVVGKAIAQLAKAGLVDPEASLVEPGSLEGCTPEEIGQIEAKFHFQLPAIYEEFLARMGRRAGRFLRGSDYPFPAPRNLRHDAETLLEESDSGFKLDEKDFVFMGHQGYQFLFFRVTDSPDPPVFLLNESGEPKMLFPQFSEWLLSCTADQIEAFKSQRRAP
jgi:hypothetical protein